MFHVVSINGNIMAAFTVYNPGLAKVTLKNLLGKTIISHTFFANPGPNKIKIPSICSGVKILQIEQPGKIYTSKALGI